MDKENKESRDAPELSNSSSLWNYTRSPGWSNREIDILKIALQKFGIGKWRDISNYGCLPFKTTSQMNLQTQRLLGQQSLAEFMGLKVDLQQIFLDNKRKKGVTRKNCYIINSGNNMTTAQRDRKRRENQKLYGLTKEQLDAIQLPPKLKNEHLMTRTQIYLPKTNLSTIEKLYHLHILEEHLVKEIERRKRKASG